VLGERVRIRLGTELTQQLRRPLDVREEERDRAGREVAHGEIIRPGGRKLNTRFPVLR
jgi:hypothetical protein